MYSYRKGNTLYLAMLTFTRNHTAEMQLFSLKNKCAWSQVPTRTPNASKCLQPTTILFWTEHSWQWHKQDVLARKYPPGVINSSHTIWKSEAALA